MDYTITDFTPYEPLFSERMSVSMPKFIDYTSGENEIAVNFSDTLDAEEQEIFDDVVDNNYPPSDLMYKIYTYMHIWDQPMTLWPEGINYLRQLLLRLHPKKVREFGELKSIIYYGDKVINGDGTATYANPVVQETFYYSRDPATGMPSERRLYIQWYFMDGTIDNKFKLRVKDDYVDDFAVAIKEITSVRDFNVLEIIKNLIPMILLTDEDFTTVVGVLEEGRRFFEAFAIERSLYVNDGNSALEVGIRNQDTTVGVGDFYWLDNSIVALGSPLPTIRSYIIHELSRGERIA